MKTAALCLAAIAFTLAGCTRSGHHEASSMATTSDKHHSATAVEQKHERAWASIHKAVAVLYPTKGSSVSGTFTFEDVPTGNTTTLQNPKVRVTGIINGLEPNSTHACHVHEFGDVSSADGSSAGSHYDPEGTGHHADVNAPQPHHPGDLGNLKADNSGTAKIDLTLNNVSVAGMKNALVGRSVVVHTNADDFSQPVGNAGGRIAVGVIGIAKP